MASMVVSLQVFESGPFVCLEDKISMIDEDLSALPPFLCIDIITVSLADGSWCMLQLICSLLARGENS